MENSVQGCVKRITRKQSQAGQTMKLHYSIPTDLVPIQAFSVHVNKHSSDKLIRVNKSHI